MEIQDTVYGENATVHMMNGNRNAASNLWVPLVGSVAKIMEDDLAFQDQVKELEKLYTLMAIGENYLESLLQSECIYQIDKAIDTQKGMNLQEPLKPAHCWSTTSAC